MTRYAVRRFVAAVATLLTVSIIVFVAGRLSGDPRPRLLGDNATPEQYELLGEKLGLDRPLYLQYLTYLKQVVVGDFGESIVHHRPTIELIVERMPATLTLATAAFAFATIIGLALGVFSAARRGGRLDKVIQIVALTGQAIPSFWLGIMLIFVFAVHFRWFPASGGRSWDSIVLPAFALGWYFLATFLRLMRSSMLDVLDAEYVTMARARGLSRRSVVWKHAARNALLPPLTFVGVTLGTLVTGSLVIETVFAWPGLGKLAIDAVLASDYPVLQGTVIVFTALYIGASLLVDLLYVLVDPRVRLYEAK
jgi:peptide/nickel transport system permease protein